MPEDLQKKKKQNCLVICNLEISHCWTEVRKGLRKGKDQKNLKFIFIIIYIYIYIISHSHLTETLYQTLLVYNMWFGEKEGVQRLLEKVQGGELEGFEMVKLVKGLGAGCSKVGVEGMGVVLEWVSFFFFFFFLSFFLFFLYPSIHFLIFPLSGKRERYPSSSPKLFENVEQSHEKPQK